MGELVGVTWDRHNTFFTGIDLGRMPGWRFFQTVVDLQPQPGIRCILEREVNETFTLDEDDITHLAAEHWPASSLEPAQRYADLGDLLTTLSAFQALVAVHTTDGGSRAAATGRVLALTGTELTFQPLDTGPLGWRPAQVIPLPHLIGLEWGTGYDSILKTICERELGPGG